MTRRKFTREFKIEAVRLVTKRGVAVAQAARDLDLAESVLRRWMRELTTAPAAAFPGNGQMRADLAEKAPSGGELVAAPAFGPASFHMSANATVLPGQPSL